MQIDVAKTSKFNDNLHAYLEQVIHYSHLVLSESFAPWLVVERDEFFGVGCPTIIVR